MLQSSNKIAYKLRLFSTQVVCWIRSNKNLRCHYFFFRSQNVLKEDGWRVVLIRVTCRWIIARQNDAKVIAFDKAQKNKRFDEKASFVRMKYSFVLWFRVFREIRFSRMCKNMFYFRAMWISAESTTRQKAQTELNDFFHWFILNIVFIYWNIIYMYFFLQNSITHRIICPSPLRSQSHYLKGKRQVKQGKFCRSIRLLYEEIWDSAGLKG